MKAGSSSSPVSGSNAATPGSPVFGTSSTPSRSSRCRSGSTAASSAPSAATTGASPMVQSSADVPVLPMVSGVPVIVPAGWLTASVSGVTTAVGRSSTVSVTATSTSGTAGSLLATHNVAASTPGSWPAEFSSTLIWVDAPGARLPDSWLTVSHGRSAGASQPSEPVNAQSSGPLPLLRIVTARVAMRSGFWATSIAVGLTLIAGATGITATG